MCKNMLEDPRHADHDEEFRCVVLQIPGLNLFVFPLEWNMSLKTGFQTRRSHTRQTRPMLEPLKNPSGSSVSVNRRAMVNIVLFLILLMLCNNERTLAPNLAALVRCRCFDFSLIAEPQFGGMISSFSNTYHTV